MRVPLTCPQCMHEDLPNAYPYTQAEYTDSNRYETVCPLGHRGVVALQQQKFEILFEIGAYAIDDGYYREAVSSFTSSLERFYEFFIRAFFHQNKLDVATLDTAWKFVAHQSERQLGAFIAIYTTALRKAPNLLPQKKIEFRNSVIHKGKIPTREEAVEYGETVLELIRPAMREAQDIFSEGVGRTTHEHLSSAYAELPETQAISTLAISTILSLVYKANQDRSLAVALEQLRINRRWSIESTRVL